MTEKISINKISNNHNMGFVKIYRSFLDWEWYDDINTTRLFIHCILKAYYEDTKYRGIIFKRGSFSFGRKLLAKEVGLSEQQLRTSLSKLKSTNEITIKSTSKFSVISIVNYDLYQKNNQQNNQQDNQRVTNEQPTNNQQITTIKEIKNIRNKELKENNIFRPPTILEIKDFLKEKGITTIDADRFYYFYDSKGWLIGKTKMKSWKSAIMTWKNKTNTLPHQTNIKTYEQEMEEYNNSLRRPQKDDWKYKTVGNV